MLSISRQVDYAIQLITRLKNHSARQPLSLRAFSEESTISFLFLQKITRRLKLAGLVDSTKGARGGYFIPGPVKHISLKQVLEAIEGPYALVDCMRESKRCEKESDCTARNMWKDMHKTIIKQLEETNVV